MTPKPPRLLRFSDPRDYQDGTVSFSVDREDGMQLAVSCSIDELSDILNYVFGLARVTEGEDMRLSGSSRVFVPVSIDQLGVGTCDDPDRTILVAKMAAFELALSIANNGLSGFSDDLARTLKTLSAPRDQKN
jgi:hypothetical protein